METSQLSIVDRLRKRQRLGRVKMYESLDSIVSKLENFIDKDNSENSDSEFQTQISDLFEDIKHDEPLRAVCKEHRETYAYISKLGKEIDNMNTMNPEDLQSLKVAQLDESIIDRVIHEYLMLEGMFDEAEILQLIKKIQCEMVDAKDQFKMIFQVLKSLEDGDVDFALKWVEENSSALKSSNNLQFNLHKLKILDLLRKKDSISAIDYTRAHLHVFHNTHLGEIQQLLGACLFLSQPENSHYQELLDPGYNKVIAQELIHEWCKLSGLPYKSSLITAITAGNQILPELLQLASKIGDKIWSSQLATELNLDPKLKFHSIFVCPVSREISTPDNPPMLLPCGHMISKHSMERLLSSSTRGKFKCPTCPVEASERDIKLISIW